MATTKRGNGYILWQYEPHEGWGMIAEEDNLEKIIEAQTKCFKSPFVKKENIMITSGEIVVPESK